jgi:3',5'-cyclic AMP phosphodiesterase CpdA
MLFMKKHFGLLLIFVAALVGFIFLLLQDRKTQTSVKITAISLAETQVGETIRVSFAVTGGAEDFTIIVLPDTQHYSDLHPELYHAQTTWIAEQVDLLNIVFVTHLGDIVQNREQDEGEWIVADAAMARLDGIVPYSVLPGNHDMAQGGTATFYETYFPVSRFEDYEWWGGDFNKNKNNYQLFSAGGDDYVILHMQFCPSDEAITWADEVLEQYADRRAILSTHSFLDQEGQRVGKCKSTSDGNNSGINLWNKLVRPNPNIFLVLSGHIPGAARRTDSPNGIEIFQLLSDYQDDENYGNGYLRIMRFQPNVDRVQVTTYSPAVDAFMTDAENQFELIYNMTGGPIPSGTVTVSNGADECTTSVAQGYCELETVTDSEMLMVTYSGDDNFKSSQTEMVLEE